MFFLGNLVLLFIFSLFLGRWLYFLVLIYEGRTRFAPYKCMYCFHPMSLWPLRRSRCLKCDRKFDKRSTLMEFSLAFGLTSLLLVLGYTWFTLEVILFYIMALTASVVDLRRTILPDTMTLGGIVVVLLGAFLNPEREFMEACVGVLVGSGGLLIFSYSYFLVRKIEGLGGGDIKMVGWIGGLLGWNDLFYVLSLACGLGVLYWIFIGIQKYKVQKEIPFGPYLSFATYLFILFKNIGMV